MSKKYDISVIIVSYNSQYFLRETIRSLLDQSGLNLQIIVVDNNSTDQTPAMMRQEYPDIIFVRRQVSDGFAAANNLGVKYAQADSILFLNPDVTFTTKDGLLKCYQQLQKDQSIGCLTPKVNLALTGQIDETCHRGFPTPWAAASHFSGLSRLFPKLPLFNGYTKSYLGYDHSHYIDSVGGMFMLMRKSVGQSVGWWDEEYPFYGEDLDFCYRLTQAGYHNLYYPEVTVLHYKGVTTGMSRHSQSVTTATSATTRRIKSHSVDAMATFYRKHLSSKYPFFINWIVYFGIDLMRLKRVGLS